MPAGIGAITSRSALPRFAVRSRLRRLTPIQTAALVAAGGGVLLRLTLVLVGVPPTNSDEATMGLAALHIAGGVDRPVWFYGQAYMGTLEAYLAAPGISLLGTHLVALRLPSLLLFAAFLLLVFRLTSALYTPGLAAFTVLLLSLGADRTVKNEMIMAGGYPEILPAAALLLLLSVWLTGAAPHLGSHRRSWRLWAFAAWGGTAGLCLWVDWLVLPYVGAAGLLLLVGCGRELWGWAGGLLAGGAMLGAAPLIIYNLTAAPGLDSLSVYSQISGAGTAGLAANLHGTVLVGIPLATGLCAPSHCGAPVLAWGPIYLALLLVATAMAVRAIRRTAAAERSRELARLALLFAAGLTLLAYARSASSAQSPMESARYLHCLLVSLPAVLWPVWRLATVRVGTARLNTVRVGTARWPRVSARAALVLLVACAVTATGAHLAHVAQYRQLVTRQHDLIAALDRMGATHIYSEYWTCDRIVFATAERIVCAVLNDDLSPGFDRYAPYRAAVNGASRVAYVLPVDSPIDNAFISRMPAKATNVSVIAAGGYHIYLVNRSGAS